MSGSTAWQQWNVPVRLTSRTRFHVSSVILRNGAKPSRPALLTRIVGAPSASRDLGDRGVDAGPVGDVDGEADGRAAGRGDLGGGLVGGVAVAVEHADGDAVGGQALGDGQADAGAAAGDDGVRSLAVVASLTGSARRRRRSCGACRAARSGRRGRPGGARRGCPRSRRRRPATRGGRRGRAWSTRSSRSSSRARPSSGSMPDDVVGGGAEHERLAAGRGGVHTSGCSLAGRVRQIATSSGDGSLLNSRCDASIVCTTRTPSSRVLLVVGRGPRRPRRCWRTRSRRRSRPRRGR